MAGGDSPDSGAGEDIMGLLKTMRREELLEVLSGDFCQHCQAVLTKRVREVKLSGDNTEEDSADYRSPCPDTENSSESSYGSSHKQESGVWGSGKTPDSLYSTRRKGDSANSTPLLVNSKPKPHSLWNSGSDINGVQIGSSPVVGNGLPEEQNEQIRVSQVGRKKDFVHIERINGKPINVLQGLELHTKVFNKEEQKKIVESVYNLQRMGQKGQLRERTYSEPRKWMRGKGRITLQFGCCYNYAVDKNGNPPGIIREEDVDPLPPMFKQMIKRMIRWHVLPPTCVPNSCIVNIYDEGDCIPPHIDHHDFLRPFCTVSFLAECNILFGSNLKIAGPGEFSGPVSVPLPVGSVLILNGNGADVAKHCVPGVPAKRISITFRKMDESKIPYNFSPDPELVGLKPLVHSPSTRSPVQQNQLQQQQQHRNARIAIDDDLRNVKSPFVAEKDEFPPLGGAVSLKRMQISNGPKR